MSSLSLKAFVRAAIAPRRLRSAQKRFASAASRATAISVLARRSKMARIFATPRLSWPSSCPTTSIRSTAFGVPARAALTR